MDKVKKIFNFEVKQEGPEEDRVLRFVGSDETPDRDNDIIEVAGWKVDDYLKNPVFLWAHSYHEPPVGKAVNVTIDATAKKLLFDIKFPTVEEYPFADTVYKLYKGGYLRATSVGFRGTKHKARDEEEVLALPEWRRGRRYMEQHLLELSAVPVPSNPNALMQAKSAGIDIGEIKNSVIYDEASKVVKVIDDEGLEKTFTLEFLKELDEVNLATYQNHSVQIAKLATFVSENKIGNPGEEAVDIAIAVLSEGKSVEEDGPKVIELSEIKQALDELKGQVLLLLPKQVDLQSIDAPKVEINLDAIELSKAEKDPNNIELNIEPEQLKSLIKEIIQESIQGGI